MKAIETKAYGTVEIDEADILTFCGPVLGFEGVKEYAILQDTTKPSPFVWLQAVGQAEPAFVVMDPKVFKSDYQPKLAVRDLESIKLENDQDLRLLVIISVPEQVGNISANLTAPIIVNSKQGLAKQVVLENQEYPLRYYLIPAESRGERDASPKPQEK